jgi:antitoxin ParD1/3/4
LDIRASTTVLGRYESLCFIYSSPIFCLRHWWHMADSERMTVVFPDPLAEQFEAGEFASTSEAVLDAVRLWGARRELSRCELEILGRAWDEGKASGSAGPLSIADVIADAKAERALKG